MIGAVAHVSERRIGEGEDHPAVRDAVAVEHVGAHHHRDARIIFAGFLDGDAPGWAGAFAREHFPRDPVRELVRVHWPFLSC